jgi:hypothetical protein
MNSLLSFKRSNLFGSALLSALRRPRPKLTPKTIQKRKEEKRLKLTNKFSADNTGEKPLHVWMDPKKMKSLALCYQEYRNKHRLTRNMDVKDQKEFGEKSIQFSEIFVKTSEYLTSSTKNGEKNSFC